MKIKNYITGSILFLAIMACIVPGLSQPAAPPVDLSQIPTIVVLTANAAITQTAAVAPPLPAETATPGPAGTTGTLELLDNGSAKYTDDEAGFEVIFPTGWLTLRPKSDEFNSALEKDAVKNKMLGSQMQLDLADYEPGLDRLYSYAVKPDIKKNFTFGFSELTWDSNDTAPIDENSMGELVRGLESSGSIPGFRADTAQVYENVNKIELVEVGGQFSISDGKGGITPFYLTAVFFKPTSGSTIRITFTYLKDYKLPISVDVMSVITSIKLLSQ